MKVWDPVVRSLHWTLAILVMIDLVRDDGDWPHRMVGYAAVVVVLVRLTWAAVARGPAGLAALRPSLAQSITYLGLLRRGVPPVSVGHNPLGLWMVWLLWLLVLLLGLTGWMSRLDGLWGVDWPKDIHAVLADLLLASVVVHLAGVGLMSWLWRENLPAAMVTGRKRPPG